MKRKYRIYLVRKKTVLVPLKDKKGKSVHDWKTTKRRLAWLKKKGIRAYAKRFIKKK